jgi:fibronectin-binding autotransporter adhesin
MKVIGTFNASGTTQRLLAALVIFAAQNFAVHAQNNTWINAGDGYWTNAANWSLGVPDQTFAGIFITNALSKTVTLDAPAGTISNFNMGAAAGTTNVLALVEGSSIEIVTLGGGVSIIGTGAGLGRLSISGGTLVADRFSFGNAAGRTGLMDISGGDTRLQRLWLGDAVAGSTGRVVITGGSLHVTNGLNSGTSFGLGRAGYGEVILSNGFLLAANTLVGFSRTATIAGSGKLLIYGGTNLVLNLAGSHQKVFQVGSNHASSTGDVVVAGTGVLDASTITIVQVGDLGVGTISVSENGLALFGALTVGADVSTASGTIAVTGGKLFVTNAAGTAVANFHANSTLELGNTGVVTLDRLFVTNTQAAIVFNGGTLKAGQITVDNGSELVVGNGSDAAALNLLGGSHFVAGGLTLNTNATLGGAGFSTLNLGGDLALLDGSTFSVDLSTNSPTPGVGYDRVFVTGAVTIADSILSLNLTNFTAVRGDIFTLIANDGTDPVTGTFAGLAQGVEFSVPGLPDGEGFKISYLGGSGNDVILIVIPEPSALALVLAAAAVMIWRRR